MPHPENIQPENIPQMEVALAERGIPVAELCRRAEIAETTWGRWKRKEFMPSYRSWKAVKSAFADLLGFNIEEATE